MMTLKALSALLSYPTLELQSAARELNAALLAEAILPPNERGAVAALADDIASRDLTDAQERYVYLFDRTRSLSLHLFEHVHGESRDRGQAMVDLLRIYQEAGYSPVANELPDYLPMFLEFAATRAPEEALALVAQPGHVLAALQERLERRKSPYASVFGALVALGDAKLDEATLAALRSEPDPEPDDLEALDAAWAEEEVRFGPGSALADCGQDELAAKIRQARRPAPGLERPDDGRPRVVTPVTPRA
jgi:nitrate reductase delta subunit